MTALRNYVARHRGVLGIHAHGRRAAHARAVALLRLGYTPVELAFLFLFYEFFGVVTNLVGGWIAARLGLRVTLLGGLALQVVALRCWRSSIRPGAARRRSRS